MRIKTPFEQFTDFVSEQPVDKVINHQNYTTCAVGEFLGFKPNYSSVTLLIDPSFDGYKEYQDCCKKLNDFFGEDMEKVSKIVADSFPSTYGELLQSIEDFDYEHY